MTDYYLFLEKTMIQKVPYELSLSYYLRHYWLPCMVFLALSESNLSLFFVYYTELYSSWHKDREHSTFYQYAHICIP